LFSQESEEIFAGDNAEVITNVTKVHKLFYFVILLL